MNLTITTAIETITFFSVSDFLTWNENENQYRIDAYKMIGNDNREFGSKGMNAGANLYEILDAIAA